MQLQQPCPDKTHYLHTISHQHSERTLIRSFHVYQSGIHYSQIAIVNHNMIEVYRIIGSSVVYLTTYQFMCDITVLQIIPAKGENNDVFFIADDMGRYQFWGVGVGCLMVNSVIKAPEYMAPAYQRIPAEQKQPQFSGISCTYSSLDTFAVIFFTVSTKIIMIKIRLSKNKIQFTVAPVEHTIPYVDVLYIGILNGKDPYIGFIEQRQQKTFLRLHKSTSQHFECSLSIQKANLSKFYNYSQTQQLITVTTNQLSIYNIKTQQNYCTFQIPQAGYIANIDTDLYVYVGEIGSQMIVFNKKHYKSYGAFMLENQVCMRLAGHGKLADDGYLITVIDQGYTVEFIALYENSWRSIRSIFSTASIFSVEDLDKNNQTLAVVRVGESIYQTGILSKHLTSKLQKQTPISSPIVSLFSTNSGHQIILATPDCNSVFTYSQQHECFQVGFQFESGTIVNVLDKYVIMENKIYEIDIGNKSVIKQLWSEKTGIVDGDFDGKFIGFQCGDFSYKFMNTLTKQIDRVRKNCSEEYIWKFHTKEILLVACLDQPGKLKIVPVFKQATTYPLNCKELITDIISLDNKIIISFNTCEVQIYEYPNIQLRQSISCSSSPLQLIRFKDQILGYSGSQAYVFKFDKIGVDAGVSYRQVEFDSSKDNVNIVYLEKYSKFVVGHSKSLALYGLDENKPEHTSSFRVLSVSMDQIPPFSTVHKNILYIVQNYQVITRNINTAELLKKQSHGLKQICCIQKLEIGLVVCGINDMDSVQIFVFNYSDLQILCAESLHKSQIFDKKIPNAIRKKNQNSFFLREGGNISLYQITKDQLNFKQIFSSKINLSGYTLAVQPELTMVMASDPLRYLVVYDYRLDKLVSLCRYQNLNTINDVQFLEHAVVSGNSIGNLNIVQFDLNKDDINRTLMTEVANYKTGSQIINIRKGKTGVIYSTISGSVGRLTPITYQQFKQLKNAEKTILASYQSQNQLKYHDWTMRQVANDKLVDGYLIQQYLNWTGVSESSKKSVRAVWQNVWGKIVE